MNITELKQFITLAEFYIWVNLMLTFLTVIGFILYGYYEYQKQKPAKPERPTNERLEQRLEWLRVDTSNSDNVLKARLSFLEKRVIENEQKYENINNLPARRTSNKTTGKRNV